MLSPTRNLLKIFFHNNCRILNRLHAEDNIVLEKINIRKSLFNYKFLHTLQLNKDGRKIMILIKQTELQTFNFLETKVGENGMNERVMVWKSQRVTIWVCTLLNLIKYICEKRWNS